ncbi:DUF4312 family protein [Lactiplantibacillus daowaiensis]|uniref:DUF4312 family protein n=1 Tax=Lactiplantibacillus daowaiensis TaxID=2559918 RepID=A0ABW1S2P0_9LACO
MATAINTVTEQTVQVSGQGETKQKAFASALSQIQKQIVADTAQVTLQIQPLTVTPIDLTATTYTERFLFLFFPRKRTTFNVTLAVTVQLNTIALPSLDFTTVQTQPIKLPHWDILKGGK